VPALSRRDGVLLLAILAVGFGLRMYMFAGYVMTDDVYYVERALELAQGDLTAPQNYWAARLGLVGPMALAFHFLGVAEWTAVLFPFVCSLLSIGVTFVLGRRMASTRAGLLAAALIATFPQEVVFASLAFPATPITLLTGLTFLWFLQGEEQDRTAPLVLAGMALGAASLVHETALLCFVFLVPYACLRRRIAAKWLLAGMAFLLVWGLDPLFHGLAGADPLVRYQYAASSLSGDAASPLAPHPLAPLAVPTLRPFLHLVSQQELGLLFAAALVLGFVGLRGVRLGRHPTAEQAASLWIVALFLWINYGTVSPAGYQRLWLLPRMLAPLTIPACALVAARSMTWRPAFRGFVLGPVVAASLFGVLVDDRWARSAQFDALDQVLEEQRPSLVLTDTELLFHVRFYASRLAVPVDLFTPESLVAAPTLGQRTGPRLLVTPRPLSADQRGRVTEIAALIAPETLKERLFAEPWFVSIVALTRSPEQMEMHRAEARPATLHVYSARWPPQS